MKVQQLDLGVHTALPMQNSRCVSRMNPITIPGCINFHPSLIKSFVVHERYIVKLRLESYNSFNNPEFNSVNIWPSRG
jgi:hypothetical protein